MTLRLKRPHTYGPKGRYLVSKELGQGGFGVVYKARDKLLHRSVAVKVLDNTSSDARHRFVAEARKLGTFNEPNIVTVYDVGTKDGQPYYVMELLPSSFVDFIDDEAKQHNRYDEVAPMLKDVLRGLVSLHERNWIHRDIKPSNVLLTTDDRAKIADFGLVKDPCSSLTRSGAILGTFDYMAPEQRRGIVSLSSDVYSFGLVVYRALVGGWPTDDDAESRQEELLWPRLRNLLMECLSECPADRPCAQEALIRWDEIDKHKLMPRSRRRVRSDARVGSTLKKIEGEYGLPQGSVRLFRPDRKWRPLRIDAKIGTLRRLWGE